ncbi:LysR family transcriptional regulator [Candidatus Thiodictyon syntrophicum]|jgi:DNA-binding transcriptional LysR family regulator|uniref:LysR family transcriptional regulator n=2 Tax=Candidatus Thiodictyon syntrophicum TaxID=1166950 RepID=A0A2K8U8B5_9GAMM|nr:LysR family transcriptional regulator [Candidatus Thiodictyon syntrophicum]AFH41836.1 transcriptional regulator LysR family protein CbbR [Candidatus Thiodictyon syntrophicum str. Cad16]AFJ79545.1 transcriptional regulator LysR family [Candidatus Thiodictyon syntrophicum str. Cad16]AUB81830.1 LysR family transcriptional regulator [Candidatus Thiodictyon syntrophicum]
MHLTLRQLRVFEAVARHLSYTRAAEELHLSQPAVSMQVRQLEEAAGLPLFERLGKGVGLTEAGREVYSYSRSINRSLQEMDEVMQSLKGVNRGRLHVAVASTVNYFAPRLLAVFHQRYPGITPRLDVTNRETLMRLLDSNSIDIAVMGQPPTDIDVESESFMENPLVVIAPPTHPLVSERLIPTARLTGEVFVMREPGSGTRQAMERFFKEQGLTIRHGMQMTRNEAVKQAVRSGLGLSVVSLHTIELELETGRLMVLDVEGFPLARKWHLVYRRGKRLSPAARAFRDFVVQEGPRIAAPAPLPTAEAAPPTPPGPLSKPQEIRQD